MEWAFKPGDRRPSTMENTKLESGRKRRRGKAREYWMEEKWRGRVHMKKNAMDREDDCEVKEKALYSEIFLNKKIYTCRLEVKYLVFWTLLDTSHMLSLREQVRRQTKNSYIYLVGKNYKNLPFFQVEHPVILSTINIPGD